MCDSRDSNKSVFQNVLVSLELTIGIVFHSLIVIAFVFGYQSGERGMLFYFVCYQYISICGFSIASQFVTVKEICIVCTIVTRLVRSILRVCFLWKNPKTDHWSKITWIKVHQRNRKTLSQIVFIGSFNALWSQWSWINDPFSHYPKESEFAVMYCQWKLSTSFATRPCLIVQAGAGSPRPILRHKYLVPSTCQPIPEKEVKQKSGKWTNRDWHFQGESYVVVKFDLGPQPWLILAKTKWTH